jgi:Holliday junction DNA helicase RuvB
MFDDFIGQRKIVRELKAINAGLKKSNKSLNILLRGPAGCGKTMLAEEFCSSLCGTYGIQIANKRLNLSGIEKIRCQVVDEIHEINQFEHLYQYMDSGKYVFVFCTTESGELPEPFTSRCITLNFEDYTIKDLATIGVNHARKIGLLMNMGTAFLVAKRARGSPRKVKNYIQRIKFIIDQGLHPFTIDGVNNAFESIGILDGGYTDVDMAYLNFISGVKSASLSTVSRAIRFDENTIKNDVEPFLLEKGHIEITSRGRKFLGWKGLKQNESN